MCLVCIEYSKQKITAEEGMRNIGEMREQVGEEHYQKVFNQLNDDILEKELDDIFSPSNYYEQVGFGD